MKKYLNKYILDKLENGVYNHRWLRRISRTTKTQAIADVRRILITDEDHPQYNKNDAKRELFQRHAFRMNEKNGKLVQRLSRNHNNESKRNIEIVDNFNKQLKCSKSFDELFNKDIDIRNLFYDQNSREVKNLTKHFKHKIEFIKELITGGKSTKPEKLKKELNNKKLYPELDQLDYNDRDGIYSNYDIYGETMKHLYDLFGKDIEIYRLRNEFDLFHEASLYRDTVTHYHITHHGGNKNVVSTSIDNSNKTISFWLFDVKIVFTYSDGVSSW